VRLILNVIWLGIPRGIASFKLAGAALVPFGKEIVRISDLEQVPAGAIAVGHSV
jgi:uncharacterized membrane protein YccF (DUF307 family)